MIISDETVMAYVDGELDDATRASVEAALATDPDLAQRVARHRELRNRVQDAFDPVLAEPVPERLLAAAKGIAANARDGNIVALKRIPARRWTWPQWGAIAASLVLGVLVAPLVRHQPAVGALDIIDGEILASGVLAHALSQQLASNQSPDAPTRIGVSFLSRSGHYCRTFELQNNSALAGLACRDGVNWRLEALALTRARPPTSGEYRPAAASLSAVIEQAVRELIEGDPLDAQGEAVARSKEWH